MSCICSLSREYLDNIGLVDTGVADLVSMVEDFFDHDGRTAYVFTSDHGMTNWGRTLVVVLQLSATEKKKNSYANEFTVAFCIVCCVSRFPRSRPSLGDSHTFSGVGSRSYKCPKSHRSPTIQRWILTRC